MAFFDYDSTLQALTESQINLDDNPIDIKNVHHIIIHSIEGNSIPHIHIQRRGEHDCCVMLKENRFFDHAQNDGLLNAKECRELDRWFREPNFDIPELNNWGVFATYWNQIPNVRFKVDLTKQPDYSTIKRYKQK